MKICMIKQYLLMSFTMNLVEIAKDTALETRTKQNALMNLTTMGASHGLSGITPQVFAKFDIYYDFFYRVYFNSC